MLKKKRIIYLYFFSNETRHGFHSIENKNMKNILFRRKNDELKNKVNFLSKYFGMFFFHFQMSYGDESRTRLSNWFVVTRLECDASHTRYLECSLADSTWKFRVLRWHMLSCFGHFAQMTFSELPVAYFHWNENFRWEKVMWKIEYKLAKYSRAG